MSAETWQRPLPTLKELKAKCVELQKRLNDSGRPGSASVVASLFDQLCARHERDLWNKQAAALRWAAKGWPQDSDVNITLRDLADHVGRSGLEDG